MGLTQQILILLIFGLIVFSNSLTNSFVFDDDVITTNPLFSGCQVEVRPIGVMHMMDAGESDDKVICVPTADPRFSHIKELNDLGEHRVKEMQHFFETYKLLQKKEVKITGIEGSAAAKDTVKKSIKLYKDKFGK